MPTMRRAGAGDGARQLDEIDAAESAPFSTGSLCQLMRTGSWDAHPQTDCRQFFLDAAGISPDRASAHKWAG